MKIALASLGFINGDVDYNKNKIIKTLAEYRYKVDLVLFGESFLQGFDALTWNFEKDKMIALEINSKTINEISIQAKSNQIGVSFGYFELINDKIYSSQITINKEGKVINNYHRVSTGWKIKGSDTHYQEGLGFQTFLFEDKIFGVGLCGDLWDEENIASMKALNLDLLLWPVYTDFNQDEWNNIERYEYAKQAKKVCNSTLYVNPFCLDKIEYDFAKGGAAYFKDGKIVKDIPSGREDILIIEL